MEILPPESHESRFDIFWHLKVHGSGKQSSFRFSHFVILAAGPDPEEEAGGGVEEDEGEGRGEAGPHRHDPSRHVTLVTRHTRQCLVSAHGRGFHPTDHALSQPGTIGIR